MLSMLVITFLPMLELIYVNNSIDAFPNLNIIFKFI